MKPLIAGVSRSYRESVQQWTQVAGGHVQKTLDDYFWWPVIPLLVGVGGAALIAAAVYYANKWANRDRQAIAIHRDVTTGDVGTARAEIGFAEFDWWSYLDRPAAAGLGFTKTGYAFEGDDELVRRFFELGGGFDRLQVVLRLYRQPRWWRRRTQRYCVLLGSHAAILAAWRLLFIGAASSVTDGELEVAPQLSDAKGRAMEALSQIGAYRTGVDPRWCANAVRGIPQRPRAHRGALGDVARQAIRAPSCERRRRIKRGGPGPDGRVWARIRQARDVHGCGATSRKVSEVEGLASVYAT